MNRFISLAQATARSAGGGQVTLGRTMGRNHLGLQCRFLKQPSKQGLLPNEMSGVCSEGGHLQPLPPASPFSLRTLSSFYPFSGL